MSVFDRFSRLLRLSLLGSHLLSCLGLAGCPFPPQLYKMDVQQGHYITPELVSTLKKGMRKQEVIDIMGTPTLCPINNDRLDYYYHLQPGSSGKALQHKHVSIFFAHDRVQDIQWARQP